MKKIAKRALAIALLAALALTLTACGSSIDTGVLDDIQSTLGSIEAKVDGLAAAQQAAPAADAAPAEEPAEAPAEEEAAAPAEKEVVVATIPNTSAPLAWQDEDGNLQGYEYEILVEIDKLLENYTFDIQAVGDDIQDLMAENGKSIVTAGGFYWNATRSENFLIPPTATGASAITIYIRSEDAENITSIQDIADGGYKIVPTSPDGGIFNTLTAWNEEHDNALGEIPTQEGLSSAERVQMVAEGQYDALVLPNNLGVADVIRETGLDVIAADEPVKVNGTYLLIQRGYEDLADEVEAALETLTENGTLSELAIKYFDTDTTTGLALVDPIDKNW